MSNKLRVYVSNKYLTVKWVSLKQASTSTACHLASSELFLNEEYYVKYRNTYTHLTLHVSFYRAVFTGVGI